MSAIDEAALLHKFGAMPVTKEQIKLWRELASEVRGYAQDMRTESAKAEMLSAAEDWEQKAAEAELSLKASNQS